MPTKPRLNFSCSAPRPTSTFDVHTNALGSLNLCETLDDTRSQTPQPLSVLPSTSMTSHFPSSSPSGLPALHLSLFNPLPPDDSTKSLPNISAVTRPPQIPAHNTVNEINIHPPVTVETYNHNVLHVGGFAMATRPLGPPQIRAPSRESSAEAEHWAAAVEYTATHKSNWKELAHWRGFIDWVCVYLFVTGSTLTPVFIVRAWESAIASCLANLVQT